MKCFHVKQERNKNGQQLEKRTLAAAARSLKRAAGLDVILHYHRNLAYRHPSHHPCGRIKSPAAATTCCGGC